MVAYLQTLCDSAFFVYNRKVFWSASMPVVRIDQPGGRGRAPGTTSVKHASEGRRLSSATPLHAFCCTPSMGVDRAVRSDVHVYVKRDMSAQGYEGFRCGSARF